MVHEYDVKSFNGRFLITNYVSCIFQIKKVYVLRLETSVKLKCHFGSNWLQLPQFLDIF